MEPASCDCAPQTTPTRISGLRARLVAAARAVVEERDQTNSDAEVNPQECKVKAHGVGPKLHVAFQHEPEPIGVLPDLSANDSREQWETEWAVKTFDGDRRGQRS